MNNTKRLETIIGTTITFIMLYLLFHNNCLLILCALIDILCLVSDTINGIISKIWGRCISTAGAINSKILLTTVFFAFLTPIALLTKLLGKDFLGLKDQGAKTYYHDINHTYQPHDLENTW